MSDETISDLAQRLVVGRKRDGRSVYEAQVKCGLILACRAPGVSMASLARECGINANQSSAWVRQYERAASRGVVEMQAPSLGVRTKTWTGLSRDSSAGPVSRWSTSIPTNRSTTISKSIESRLIFNLRDNCLDNGRSRGRANNATGA